MPFQARVLALPKDPEHPEHYQDACAIDAVGELAVIADGVASALFSRQWADILTRAVLADVPDPANKDYFAAWLAARRQEWSEQIDTTGLAWFQKAKLPNGAFSTLLWVRLLPVESEQPGVFGALRLHGFAIGDSCLFHLRGGELVRTFPIQKAEELEADPLVLGSVDLNRDDFIEFKQLDEHCYEEDLLVLCTDAIADWALRRIEAGDPPNWDEYWHMSDGQWEDEIARLREGRQMRYDDATLMLLRVVPETIQAEAVSPGETPTVVETPETVEVSPPKPKPEEHHAGEEAEWMGKFKSAGEQFSEGVELASDQALRGLKKLKDKAIQKYRQKFKKDKK